MWPLLCVDTTKVGRRSCRGISQNTCRRPWQTHLPVTYDRAPEEGLATTHHPTHYTHQALIALIVSACITLAEPDTLRTAEVTAQRRVAGLATAVTVQRIDSADIMRRGITSTADALRRMAGVNLRDYGGAGGLKTVSVRGLGAGHTAVSYDGLAVTDTRQGQIDMGQFCIDNLADIELQTLDNAQLLVPVRNMASAVVNMHTPWSLNPDHRWHATATLQQASFNTWSPALTLNKAWRSGTAMNVSSNYFFADNNYPFTLKNGLTTSHLTRNNSRMQRVTTETNVRQTLSHGGMVTAKAYFYHNYRHLPGMVHYYVNNGTERLLEQTAFGQARWQQQWQRLSVFAAAKYNWQTSQYTDIGGQYPGGALHQNYWQREAYATAGAALHLTAWLQAAYTTDYSHASQNNNLPTDHAVSRDTWLQALALQLHTARWQLMARGILHCYWNHMRHGTAAANAQRLTPSLTASYLAVRAPLWLYLRAGYKESFRMPTFTENYYYHLGSATLKPELTRQFSAGLTMQAAPCRRWWPLLALTADGYYNRVADRIVSVPYNLFVWRTVNMGDVRTAGLDVTLQSTWQPVPRHTLLLAANYTLQHSTDHTSDKLSTWHKQLAYTPVHSGAASLTWQSPWVAVVGSVSYASLRWCNNEHIANTNLPAYAECGFALYRTLQLRHSQLTLRADLVNAFDKRYEVIGRYPMPGRSYRLSIKYQL